MSDINFSIGLSKKWDPVEAGHEAASKAISQLNGGPRFMLIFCTIHYANQRDGLEKLLMACRDLVKDNVPSIGGTVTGFICPEGCHTRGVVVVSGSGKDIDISSGYANNVRRSPHVAGKKLADDINKGLSVSNKKNRLLIEFNTGAKEPKIMTYEAIRHLSEKIPNRIWWLLRDILNGVVVRYSDEGQGMEGDVLEILGRNLDNYYIIGAPTFDNLEALRNYQFYNSKVLEGSVVGLGIALDDDISANREFPPIPTNRKFKIKRGWRGFWIDQVDGKPAVIQMFKEIGWPAEYARTHIVKLMSKTYFQVFGFRHQDTNYAFPLGFFFGNSILTNVQIKKDEIELFLTSTKRILELIDRHFADTHNRNPHMSFLFGTPPIIGMFGANIYKIKENLDRHHGNSPFLFLFGAGEMFKKPGNNPIFSDYSLVMLSI